MLNLFHLDLLLYVLSSSSSQWFSSLTLYWSLFLSPPDPRWFSTSSQINLRLSWKSFSIVLLTLQFFWPDGTLLEPLVWLRRGTFCLPSHTLQQEQYQIFLLPFSQQSLSTIHQEDLWKEVYQDLQYWFRLSKSGFLLLQFPLLARVWLVMSTCAFEMLIPIFWTEFHNQSYCSP